MKIIQKILKLFGYQKAKGYVLTDEDRARAIETNRLKSQINNLQKQADLMLKLDKVNQIFNPKMKPEEMLMQVLMTKMMNPQSATQQQTNIQPDVSDDEIIKFLDENKAYVKHAKKLSDLEISNHIKTVATGISDNTITRAIEIIRSKY